MPTLYPSSRREYRVNPITINPARPITLSLLKFYKRFVSPFLPVSCRHLPTCSEYAYLAIEKHGVFRGAVITAKRLLRCRPYGTKGYDPVP
ncbi:MAG: membrane protein insertion efficiency factor YidD [SAR202 cluster bacterium]|nr:MAG: membrane protein insertion efficiency factor YidD [SAR202 cluster bacterium]KAA1302812.1 MAG: membrane protein insertion efficiency factor YidD [SAR202 cluster bacterium]MEC8987025.1 membrane protein insertion efficiency factor YidD [Chloroflexota bacterium]MEE3346433.1 membrane protein insertion efficiency factor YidD [Chloroflexota bacterium]